MRNQKERHYGKGEPDNKGENEHSHMVVTIKRALGNRVTRRSGRQQNQKNASNDCSQHFDTPRSARKSELKLTERTLSAGAARYHNPKSRAGGA